MCICFCTSICIYRNAGSWKPVQRDGTTPRSKKLNVWIFHQPQRWVLLTSIEVMRVINNNGIELPRRNHILILLKGRWECCAGKPRAKEQHSEGCWDNTPSVDSFNGQTPHIVNNIIFLVMITADTFPHISTWIPQSCSPHPWVLRINSSGEVSGINSLLKLFLALICPNSGNWTWRGVLSREPWVHSPN